MSRRVVLLASLLGLSLVALSSPWWAFDAHPTSSVAPAVEEPAPRPQPANVDDELATSGAAEATTRNDALEVAAPPTSAARLHGVVRDDLGLALASFRVLARPVRAGNRAQDTRTRAYQEFSSPEGGYALDLAPGRWLVSAEGRGCVSPTEEIVLGDGDAELDLVVPRAASVSGRVEDPFGQAVPSARICLLRRDSARVSAALTTEPIALDADEEGRFAFTDVAPGAITLEASAPVLASNALAPSELLQLELAPGHSLQAVPIRLRHPGTIRVLALDDHGEPDASRKVGLFGFVSCASGPAPEAKTDGNGRGEFERLPPGHYALTRRPNEYELKERDTREGARTLARLGLRVEVDVREGETVEVVLGGKPEHSVKLWGFVSGFQTVGERITVNAYADQAPEIPLHQFAALDEQGRYEIVLDTIGPYHVTVEGHSGMLLEQQVEILALAEQRLDLTLGTAALLGRVVDANGAPIAHAELGLTRPDTARPEKLVQRSETNAEGQFAFTALEAGTYELTARAPRGPRTALALDVAATKLSDLVLVAGERREGIELRFGAAAVLEVEVVGTSGPVAGIGVRVADARGKEPDVPPARPTDARGLTRIDGLAPGTWFVQAVDKRFACAWSEPIELVAGVTARARLVLEPGATLDVEVTGAPQPGIWLIARDVRGFELARAWARADQRKAVALAPLPLGKITVHAEDENGHARSVEVTIESSRPPPLAFDLR